MSVTVPRTGQTAKARVHNQTPILWQNCLVIESTMTATAWTALLLTFAAAVIMPGPDSFLVLRLGIRERRAALLASCGIMAGNAVWTTASILGLAALMQALPAALPILQLCGSIALSWMGYQSIRGGIRGLRSRSDETGVTARVTEHPFRLGVITNLSNPKALLFFTALFSQLLPGDATTFDRIMILVWLTVVGLVWFVAFSIFTSAKSFQRWFGRATPFIDIAAGCVFLLVAIGVLAELGFSLLTR